MKLLLVEDEPAMASTLRDNLVREGYEVDIANGGLCALDLLRGERYDLMILDVMMPDMNGFEVAEQMQRNCDTTPIIFLTARSADEDKLRGLGLGGDDYITKPFHLLEFLARVKVVLKRTLPGSTLELVKLGETTADLQRGEIHTPDAVHEIGRYEIAVLRLLASKPGKIFSRDEILDRIWGLEAYPSNRTVDNYVAKLRAKLEPDPKKPIFLLSEYGAGYKLVR